MSHEAQKQVESGRNLQEILDTPLEELQRAGRVPVLDFDPSEFEEGKSCKRRAKNRVPFHAILGTCTHVCRKPLVSGQSTLNT
jgi:hypothetical protein